MAGARAAVAAQLVEHRLEQVDRHEHVAGNARAVDGAQRVGDIQRADAHQLAMRIEQARAAVVGARRAGEQCAVDPVLPVADEGTARHQARDAHCAVLAAAGDHQRLLGRHRRRAAQRHGGQPQRRQRLQQAEAGGYVVGQHARGNDAILVELELHLVGLQDEITDGEHQAIVADDDAGAFARAPEHGIRACIFDRQCAHAHHGGMCALQGARHRLELAAHRGGSQCGRRGRPRRRCHAQGQQRTDAESEQ